ncbi:GDSL-type esterase/lipase family protein [Coraliomargarita algicola]|uniref:GDSL-type esterase/lipase family protein n=1 Tax=Coraliomargarita algicola TaxID=3092156 RepID=A0ABZ0RKS2_9BACT|nr:GDSL-type esterase/lipase family protein [Coraliomargarita sp. J2-16]WPJ96132.1 GDSL-type esterase/lipase family protein [Coraliomargarita sp. J2-16]
MKYNSSLLIPFLLMCSMLFAGNQTNDICLTDSGLASLERKPDADPLRYLDYVKNLQKAVKIAQDEERPIVLCIGSSSFRRWAAQEALPEFRVINFGFGGSRFSDVNALWSYLIPPVKPDYILIYEGDNDVVVGKSVFQVYEDFLETMGRLQAEFPDSKIIIVPVKPSPNRVKFWPKAQSLNAAMKVYATSRENITMVEGAHVGLLDEAGIPHPQLYLDDGIHFTEEGYAVWNVNIRASLLKLSTKDL